ncbi:MAG TPA: serine protease [Lutibacter sp.]|nr:serine protease [Lutibacter sp.]
MKNYLLLLLSISLLLFSCKKNDELINDSQDNQKQQEPTRLLNSVEIEAAIDQSFQEKNSFNWKEASNQLIWSAAIEGQQVLSIGYGDKSESFSLDRSTTLIALKEEIIELVMQIEELPRKEILLYEDAVLNYIDLKVSKLETIEALRNLERIRYIEPTAYELTENGETKSASGCSTSSESISSSDYGTLSTGAKIPWNFYDHKIEQAWAYSKGSGITVGVIDTGVSQYQPNMSYKFDDYYSNRYIHKYGTYVDSWKWWATNTDGSHDKCGHGTSACSAIGSPNNSNYAPVGVAYECNLVSYRGTSDVLLNGYHERRGVKNALIQLANRSDVKIISMSIGYPWSIGIIEDAVEYAYYKNKMIFAAGGTSTAATNWYPVIFPASMSETIAVTGVEEQSSYDECDVCHTGSQIDFTFVMERSNNHHQPVSGYYSNSSRYFGGSSVATASTAGIAALVWSKYPSWSRTQVLNRLKSSAYFYPSQHSDFGYGNINALKAVRGW